MNRAQFEHVIRAAADAVGENELIVIGSQAILGIYPEAPSELLMSMEADVYPKDAADKAIEIDGAVGDGSTFHETFGYYAHGVGPKTMVGPAGWEDRMIVISVQGRVGTDTLIRAHCPELHDLILAKCVANRDRDWNFATEAIHSGLVQKSTLLERAFDLPLSDARRRAIRTKLESL